ncbi:MAG: purine-nucleoside phosphorylase [Alphaproteobacteria bacterium]|nr:MAG: purine-nucleoside phosphorylase [Alphaproteobacteria bacterium]
MSAAAEAIRRRAGEAPIRLGLILGSGLGGLAAEVDGPRIPFADLPGFPVSGVSGHAGELAIGDLAGQRVAVLSGRVHYYEGGDAAAMRPAIAALKALGAGALFLSNAAGSTREALAPGTLVAISDHINLSGANPLIGEATDARFTDMTDAYAPRLRERLTAMGLDEGVYAWFSGPSFETPAEIRAARILGADLVGMSTVPECILARFFGLEVAAVSLVTNYAAGMRAEPLSHAETKRAAAEAAARFRQVVLDFVAGFA